MFKNLIFYKFDSKFNPEMDAVKAALEARRFQECAASQESSIGWVTPRNEEHGALIESISGQWILKIQTESKFLPASVVKDAANKRIAVVEATTGRKPGKKEKREIAEDARLALLPMAFTKKSASYLWIDLKNRLLVVEAGAQARADALITLLVQTLDGFAVQLVNTNTSPAGAMAVWLSTKEAPRAFTMDRECELKAADESKAVVRYTRHALDTDEVAQHIAQGKVPTRVAMTWNDRVSFVLTESLQLKKVDILDVVLEGAPASPGDRKDDHFDADVAIATGELSKLIPDLLEALGGEVASV